MALFVRRRWPTVTAAAAVAALLGAAAVLAVTDDRAGDPAPPASPTATSASPSEEPAVSFDLVASASDAVLRTYADQRVDGRTIPILRLVGPSATWVGRSEDTKLLLLLVDADRPFEFGNGWRVTFAGVVRRSAPGFGQTLGLTGADLADFERQGSYVEISSYRVG